MLRCAPRCSECAPSVLHTPVTALATCAQVCGSSWRVHHHTHPPSWCVHDPGMRIVTSTPLPLSARLWLTGSDGELCAHACLVRACPHTHAGSRPVVCTARPTARPSRSTGSTSARTQWCPAQRSLACMKTRTSRATRYAGGKARQASACVHTYSALLSWGASAQTCFAWWIACAWVRFAWWGVGAWSASTQSSDLACPICVAGCVEKMRLLHRALLRQRLHTVNGTPMLRHGMKPGELLE